MAIYIYSRAIYKMKYEISIKPVYFSFVMSILYTPD